MKKIVFAGPYNPAVRKKILAGLGERYDIHFVTAQEELVNHPDTDCVVLRTLRMGKTEIEAMPKLRFIQRWGAGYDTVDIRTAGEHGIVAANVTGGNSPAVAEQTINLMLATSRNTVWIDREIHEGNWNIRTTIDSRSFMLRGKRIGLLGAGSIGRQVAKIVQAFGAEVQYYDAFRLPEETEKELNLTFVDLETLLRTSDIVSLHIPRTEETYHLLNKERLEMMKPTAILINTARGGIIDEEALYNQLKEGKLLAAGIDCFEEEPLSEDNPLLSLKNVTVSCHVGGNTADVGLLMADYVRENIEAFAENRLSPRAIVNAQYLQ